MKFVNSGDFWFSSVRGPVYVPNCGLQIFTKPEALLKSLQNRCENQPGHFGMEFQWYYRVKNERENMTLNPAVPAYAPVICKPSWGLT